MASLDGKLDEEFVGVVTDKDIRGGTLPLRVPLSVLFLREHLGHIHASQEAPYWVL